MDAEPKRGGPVPGRSGSDRSWRRPALAAALVGGGVLLAWRSGLFQLLTLENVERLNAWLDSLGFWGPAAFVVLWIAACVFFLPGLPVTLLGALVFGPVLGTVYSSVGATLGATAAFLVGRYAARRMVEGLIEKNALLRRIDAGVERQGWRMLMITRLVPIFPFNAQNYVYGLTRISLSSYIIVSFLCMLPATLAFNFMAGAVRTGEIGGILIYVAVGAVVLVLLTLVPGWVRKRYGDRALRGAR